MMNPRPALRPMYRGMSENEKMASEASRSILPSEYLDFPAMRFGSWYGRMTLGKPIQATMPRRKR